MAKINSKTQDQIKQLHEAGVFVRDWYSVTDEQNSQMIFDYGQMFAFYITGGNEEIAKRMTRTEANNGFWNFWRFQWQWNDYLLTIDSELLNLEYDYIKYRLAHSEHLRHAWNQYSLAQKEKQPCQV